MTRQGRARVAATLLAPIAMLTLVAANSAASGPAADTGVEGALAAIAAQVEAWNRGDLEAFTATYAADCTFVSPNGVTRGRDEVLTRYRARYPDRAAMGTLAIEIEDAQAIRDGGGGVVAVTVVGRWSLSYPDEPERDDASGFTLLVLERGEDGGWEVVRDASM